jgi:glycosyltransferase involved in cell wall biosynthesis
MIQIVHVISDLDTGGAEVMLAKLVGGLDRNRFSSTVISLTDRGQLGQQIESSGVAVYSLGMKRGRPDFRALPHLIKLLRAFKPAVVQSWLYHADLLCAFAVKWAGSPTLVWNVRCSNMDLEHYSLLTKLVVRVLAWRSAIPAAVVVNSEGGRSQHERLGYHPRRWAYIPNGFDMERFAPNSDRRAARRIEWQVSDDAVLIGLIARVDPMKDHATFLEAAQFVVRARPLARFVLVGKDTETLASLAFEKGLKDNVLLLGHQSDVASLLPAMDIVCLSSAFGEGFPNVLGEAMACAIPCISTDVGDARNIIDDTGIVVAVRDPKALAAAIIDLIDRGPGRRTALGIAARERIEKKYSLQKIVEQYITLYTQLGSTSSC